MLSRYKIVATTLLVLTLVVGCAKAEPTETPAPPAATPAPPMATAPPPTVPPPTEQPATQPPPAPDIPETSPAIAPIVASLTGLSLDDFFEASWKQLRLRDPASITYDGLAEEYDMRNDQLNDLSDAFIRETQELQVVILYLLRTYDRAASTSEQQISFDVYEWYLDNRVRGHEFMYHNYTVHHFIGSYHDELERLLTEIHPIMNKGDAEDYVSRLSQVDDQVEQLMEGLERREEIGVIPPGFIIEQARGVMKRYLQMHTSDPTLIDAQSLSVYTVFDEKLAELDDVSAEEKQVLLDAALTAIQESFIPAYVKILDHLEHLATIATDDAGVWKFPDGDAYYAYILRDQNSTDLTPQEIHELGLAEVERVQAEMRQVFDQLGYSSDVNLNILLDTATDAAGYYDIRSQAGKDQLIQAHETLIAGVDQRVGQVFDIHPQAKVEVVGGPMGGYYVQGAKDGSRPGAYHVSTVGSWRAKMYMASVTYHESIPGHHFQIAIAQEMDLPTFRNDIFLNGYGEGWALYAERLAWELGIYDDNPYGNVGRLYFELLRAVRLVVDTGIHSLRWTRGEARQYMLKVLGSYDEVDRYIVMPAQATGYKIGMIKILELRQRAMDQLGDQFDLKEFHRVVVGNGSMPLEILERVADDYIEVTLNQ